MVTHFHTLIRPRLATVMQDPNTGPSMRARVAFLQRNLAAVFEFCLHVLPRGEITHLSTAIREWIGGFTFEGMELLCANRLGSRARTELSLLEDGESIGFTVEFYRRGIGHAIYHIHGGAMPDGCVRVFERVSSNELRDLMTAETLR